MKNRKNIVPLLCMVLFFVVGCRKKEMLPQIDISILTKRPTTWKMASYEVNGQAQPVSACEQKTHVNFDLNNVGSQQYETTDCGETRTFSWTYNEDTKIMVLRYPSQSIEIVIKELFNNVWIYDYAFNNVVYTYRFEKR